MLDEDHANAAALTPVLDDVAAATRAEKWETAVGKGMEDGAFAVPEIEIAPKEVEE